MATKNIVPRADNEGQIGTATKKWAKVIATALTIGAADVTAAGVALIDDADAAAQIATLGTAAYSEGTWTPILSFFTIVGSAPATAGTYKRIGNMVFITVVIHAGAGGNTSVMATLSNNYITGLPITAVGNACCCISNAAGGNLGVGMVDYGHIYLPTIPTQTADIFISATYNA